MPTYEYKCATCGGVFEVKQRFSDAPLTTHEGCGGTVERIIFAPALQFKGSGWYITDYARGDGSKKDAQAKDGSPKDAGTRDSSSKDSSGNGSSTTATKSEAPASSSSSTDSKK